MRKVRSAADAATAKRWVVILRGHKIRAEVRDGRDLWVLDDACMDEARALLDRFERDPSSVEFEDAERRGRSDFSAEARADATWRRRVDASRRSLAGAAVRPVYTYVIAALAGLVTLATRFGQVPALYGPFLLSELPAGAMLPELRHGELWRLFTPALLHFNVLHIVFNLSAWLVFGPQIEHRKGGRYFLLLVLATDAGGFILEWLVQLSTQPAAVSYAGGLSGVIYGLFGYVLVKGRFDPLDRLTVDSRTSMMLVAWLVIGMLGLVGSVANGAHVGGFAVGCAWALGDMLYFRWRKR